MYDRACNLFIDQFYRLETARSCTCCTCWTGIIFSVSDTRSRGARGQGSSMADSDPHRHAGQSAAPRDGWGEGVLNMVNVFLGTIASPSTDLCS